MTVVLLRWGSDHLSITGWGYIVLALLIPYGYVRGRS